MLKNRLFFTLIFLFSCWSGIASALPFSSLVVLGDSLSDQGNVSLLSGGTYPPPEYTDGVTSGRFTNGQNYVDYLASRLGVSSAPSLMGGSNYAYGGARTDSHPLAPYGMSVLQQRDALIARQGGVPLDSSALYVVWAGANNVADILVNMSIDPTFDPTAPLIKANQDVGAIIGSLANMGARHILVPNLPDLGLVPLITGGGPQNLGATYLSNLFNQGLGMALGDIGALFPGLDLVAFDTFGLMHEIFQDPSSFGFNNLNSGCYSSYLGSGGTTCANPDSYFSWDTFHPTSAAHQILADRMLVALSVPEPGSTVLVMIGIAAFYASRRKQKLS